MAPAVSWAGGGEAEGGAAGLEAPYEGGKGVFSLLVFFSFV